MVLRLMVSTATPTESQAKRVSLERSGEGVSMD